VIAHHDETISLYGFEQGIRHARKHLGWYLDKFAPLTDIALRSEILTSLDILNIHCALERAFSEIPSQAVAA
jgi:tRNA-dihydrouridine synthase B